MKILIVDDNKVERLILLKVLQQEGHQVIEAETGTQAIEAFFEHSPSLVFLDVLMPDIDGYEVASKIKSAENSMWVPIIFLTSLTDAYDLAKCIECGGDDFVSKPINPIIIKAKVNAFSRISNLYETIEKQKREIQFHNDHLIQEQEAAKRIFNNIAHRGCLGAKNINYHLSPMSIFNGDLMLATETPMGSVRLLLADFTGHGLPAAIGALPTSEIFYGMSLKGYAVSDVMMEINSRLHRVLPRGIFCCVITAEIDPFDKTITVWNAGAPEAYVIDMENENIELIHSNHLPLGITSPLNFKYEPTVIAFSENHKFLAATDGIIEATNSDGDMFGGDRILETIKSNISQPNLCETLINQIVVYTEDADQGDDLSLVEITMPEVSLQDEVQKHKSQAQTGTLDSAFSMCLRGKSLGKFDPVPMILQNLVECRELINHRTRLFTILSELFNNALEHGVLGLDSAIKNDKDGFAKYYQLRTDKLTKLKEGFVEVKFDHRPLDEGGEVVFDVIGTGSGFNLEEVLNKPKNSFSGRGLPLLMDLCHSLECFDEGRHVKAVYRWNVED
ncbi:MAG: fused response regulator/phosphatase [Gammaproteobacteria bacterium]|nr:fused response regulator/phosphatase [Gammaproteobacteria bacterium]MDH5630047.1 fused response regulator/phosphatase [Gammaproteobacteria bacterium]